MNAQTRRELYRILVAKDVTAALNAFLLRTAKARRPVPARKIEKKQNRLSKKERRAEVRAACVARAGGWCECGCLRSFGGFQLDHYFGRHRESVEECWMLSAKCHARKTDNDPSAAYWNDLWREHCLRNGYAFKERIEHAPLPEKPIPQPAAVHPLAAAKERPTPPLSSGWRATGGTIRIHALKARATVAITGTAQ